VDEIVRAIQQAAEALEARGRPGIQPHPEAASGRGTINGWEVAFGRPDPAAPPPDLALTRPDCRCYQRGRWYTGVFERGYIGDVVLSDAFQIAQRSPAGFTHHTRHLWTWRVRTPRDFAEDVLVDQAVWLCSCQANKLELRISEHADPRDYRRYVDEVARTIGDGFSAMTARHLSRLDKTEQNKLARGAALAAMLTAIEGAFGALERAGRPGFGPVDPDPRHRERIHGWRVPIDWAALTEPTPVVTPPPMPNQVGNWSMGSGDHAQFGHVVLTGDGSVAVSWRLSYHAWDRKSPFEYANWMLLDWFMWWTSDYRPISFPMADHSEPDEYIPYVEGVSRVVTAAFNAITVAR
jgi:hypothetical protein